MAARRPRASTSPDCGSLGGRRSRCLLLHFADHRAYIADYRAARDLLARHVPGYDKKLDYAAFDPGVEQAVTRAALLGPDNPATGVGRLIQSALHA